MKLHPTPWNRLVAAARLAPADERDASAPVGFATRVSALALAGMEPGFSVLFARFSLRSLAVCALMMVLGITLNLGAVLSAFDADSGLLTLNDDPVAEWFSAAS